MEFLLATICGIFALGLILFVWSVLNDVKKRRQGLRPDRFLKQIERIGLLFIYISLFFPAIYGLLQLPKAEQLWLSVFVLFFGFLLTLSVTTGVFLKIVKKILIFLVRSPLTRSTNSIANGITFFALEVGAFLIVAGLGFLIIVLIKVMKP